MPSLGWGHVNPVPAGLPRRSLRENVTTFLEKGPKYPSPEENLFHYLRTRDGTTNLSQLLGAELAYLCFQGPDCPLLYSAKEETWYVYDQYWRAQSLAGPKVLFQTVLLQVLKRAVAIASMDPL